MKKKKNAKKIGQFSETHISQTAYPIFFKFGTVYKVVNMKGINYVNLIEIAPVVIEIWGVENDDLVVPVNNRLVCHMSFLAADTRSCVLIKS